MSAYDTKKFFEENLRLYGNADTHPEKYNLYKGIACLAEEIESMNRRISMMSEKIDTIYADFQEKQYKR